MKDKTERRRPNLILYPLSFILPFTPASTRSLSHPGRSLRYWAAAALPALDDMFVSAAAIPSRHGRVPSAATFKKAGPAHDALQVLVEEYVHQLPALLTKPVEFSHERRLGLPRDKTVLPFLLPFGQSRLGSWMKNLPFSIGLFAAGDV